MNAAEAAVKSRFFLKAMSEGPVLRIVKKDPSLALPRYESEGAAGMDLRAFLDVPVSIPPLGRVKIPTGLYMEIPPGYEAQVRPRSGLAFRQGITVLNSPGTIDSDYRGEVEVILVNLGSGTVTVNNGDRIAQMVIAPAIRCRVEGAEVLGKTERGAGGFGSTGVSDTGGIQGKT
jgi:dUTP pyrophosphatase